MSKEILRQTGKYLDDYLEQFLVNGKIQDIQCLMNGQVVPQSYIHNHDTVEMVDMMETRFQNIYGALSEATRKDFIESVLKIPDVMVVELCSYYGEKFSLWVAGQNPDIEAHVFDPFPKRFYHSPVLFNEHSKNKIWKFMTKGDFRPGNVEDNVNWLYRQNNLRNITFHCKTLRRKDMDNIAKDCGDRPVVFYAERINNLVAPITQVVADNTNAHMVIAPFLNGGHPQYLDDPVMQKISRSLGIKQNEDPGTVHSLSHPAARLYTAMQQYYCLKAAEATGRDAKVFRESDKEPGFPFHKPTHYVSTIDIEAK